MNAEPVPPIDSAALAVPAAIDRVQRNALFVGLAGAVVCVLGLFLSRPYFFRAWLVGWVFWVGVAAGSLAIFLLHHLTRGAWGLVARRVLEASARTLPLMLVLFIPLIFGVHELYPWSRPGAMADEILQRKAGYLNLPFFFVRLVVYFLIWGGLAFLLSRMSWRQDRADDPGLTRRMQLIAGPALAAYCLAVTFAAVDWLMSLEPHWFSTIYGVWLMGSQGLSALAFLILFALWLSRREPMDRVLRPGHFHDWGKLLLAFTMLWAYFSFSQFLIIWSGNLPEEIVWYLHRTRHGWGAVGLFIVIFHFALPFVLLLSRDLKRQARRLAGVAALMLFMRLVDLFWNVEPGFEHQSPAFYWLYLAAPVAIGGLWVAAFVRELKRKPLLPVGDPYLPEALAHE
ncbi:MAG TPA: hypothetical protein VF756_18725 [Thermoanaerobaculia bacterium]